MACFERYLTYFGAEYESYTKQGCQVNIFGTYLFLFFAQKSVSILLSQIKYFLFIIFNRWILEISALAFFADQKLYCPVFQMICLFPTLDIHFRHFFLRFLPLFRWKYNTNTKWKSRCSYLLVYNLLFKYVIKFVYRIKYTLVAHTHIYMHVCMHVYRKITIQVLFSSLCMFLDSSCFCRFSHYYTITIFNCNSLLFFLLCRLDLRAFSKIFFIHMNVYNLFQLLSMQNSCNIFIMCM